MRPSEELSAQRPPIAADIGGLIGDTRMISAVRQAGDGLTATEEKLSVAGITDRPPAGFFRELEQGSTLAERNDVVDQLGLRLDIEIVGMSQSRVAANGGSRDPQHLRMGTCLARALPGCGGRLGAPRQSEPMHLSDHRVARNAAELS